MIGQQKLSVSLALNELESTLGVFNNFLTMESLILAQDERWRRASYMQVERESLAC